MFRTDLLSIIRGLNTVFTEIGICHTEILKMGKITSVYTCTLSLNCKTCLGKIPCCIVSHKANYRVGTRNVKGK
jgi:hypothetical protein